MITDQGPTVNFCSQTSKIPARLDDQEPVAFALTAGVQTRLAHAGLSHSKAAVARTMQPKFEKLNSFPFYTSQDIHEQAGHPLSQWSSGHSWPSTDYSSQGYQLTPMAEPRTSDLMVCSNILDQSTAILFENTDLSFGEMSPWTFADLTLRLDFHKSSPTDVTSQLLPRPRLASSSSAALNTDAPSHCKRRPLANSNSQPRARYFLRQLKCAATGILPGLLGGTANNKSYKLEPQTGPVVWACPTATYIGDSYLCPTIQFKMTVTEVSIGNIVQTLTEQQKTEILDDVLLINPPDCSNGFIVWEWKTSYVNWSVKMTFNPFVPGQPEIVPSPTAALAFVNVNFQAGTGSTAAFASTFTCSTVKTWPAQTYSIGAPALRVTGPTALTTPLPAGQWTTHWNSTCVGGPCTTKSGVTTCFPIWPNPKSVSAPGPNFITIVQQVVTANVFDNIKSRDLLIYTTDAAMAGVKTITVNVLEFFSGLYSDKNDQITVTLTCDGVWGVDHNGLHDQWTPVVKDYTYYMAEGTTYKVTIPVYKAYPQCSGPNTCPVTTELRMQDGTAVPPGFSINLSTNEFIIDPSLNVPKKDYKFKLYSSVNSALTACRIAPFANARGFNGGTSSEVPQYSGVYWTITAACRQTISMLAGQTQIPSVINYSVNALGAAYSIIIPAYTGTPSSCGFTAVYAIQTIQETCPSFMVGGCPTTLKAGDTVRISATVVPTPATYSMELLVKDSVDPSVTAKQSFTINFIQGGIYQISCTPVGACLTQQTYALGAAAVTFKPTYSWLPTSATPNWIYTILSGAPTSGCVTGVAGATATAGINVLCSASTDVGTYSISYQVTETTSGLTDKQTVSLLISCTLTSLTPPTNPPNPQIYYHTQAARERQIVFTASPASCGLGGVTYSLVSAATIPSSVTMVGDTVKMYSSSYTLPDTIPQNYTISVKAQSGSVSNQAFTFTAVLRCITGFTEGTKMTATYTYTQSATGTQTINLTPFTQVPSGCAYSAKYVISDSSGACPACFSSCTITGTTATVTLATAGTWTNIYLHATSVGSEYVQVTSTQTFSVTINSAQCTSITAGSSTYSAATGTIGVTSTIPIITYTCVQTGPTVAFTYTVSAIRTSDSTSVSFVTVSGSNLSISPTDSLNNAGKTFTVTVTAKETNSGLTATLSFTLTVKCNQSATITCSSCTQTYYLGDSTLAVEPTVTLGDANCPNVITWTIAQKDGTALPAAIAPQTTGSYKVNVVSSDYTQTWPKIYSIRVSGTIADSTNTITPLDYDITIGCTKSISVTSSISSPISHTLSPTNSTLASTTFASNNANCATSFTYAVTPCNGSTGLITSCSPTNLAAISYGTNSCTDVTTGSFAYTITATDGKSSLTSTKAFTIQVTAGPVQSITNTGAPSATTYTIGSGTTTIGLPTYSYSPTCATAPTYAYSVSAKDSSNNSPAATLSITVDSAGIKVASSTGSDAKTYTVTVTTTVANTSLTNSQSFTLTVSANPTLTFDAISQVDYVIGGTAQTRSITYTISPTGSPNTVTLSVKLDDGSANGAALPASVTFSGTTITVDQQTYIDPVTYKIKVSATVAGATATPTPITFNVVITCTGSITVTSSIPTTSPSYTMTLGTSSYPLASTTFASNNSLCQTSFTYAITPCDSSTGPITSCSPTNLSAITYSTNSCNDVKTHSYTITATDSKSGKTATKTFTIQVTGGLAQSITNTGAPSATTYTIGSGTTTIGLPTYSYSPTCATAPTYAYSVSAKDSSNNSPAATLSITVDSTGIKVASSTGSDAKTYTVTVTTTVANTSLTNSQSFTLTVSANPTLTFDAISQVDYVIGGTAQTRSITYTISPTGSPNTVTLSVKLDDGSANGAALPASVTFSGTTITVDQQTYIDPVTYKIKVSATVAGATATPTPITFNVVITCTGSITVTSSIPTTSPSYTMTLGTSSYPLASTTFASNNSLCQTSFTYAITPCDSSTGPITSCSPTNLSAITYSTNSCTDVKTHSYTITATDSKSGKTATKTFTIQVDGGLAQSITNTGAPSATTYTIGSGTTTIGLPTYSYSPTCATAPTYAYSVSAKDSSNNSPAATLSITVDSAGIKVASSTGSDAKTYTVTVTTTVANTSLTNSQSFTLTVSANPTLTFDAISQVDYVIGGTAQTRSITYTISPTGSPNTVTLSVKLDDGSANGAALPASVTFSGTTITVDQQTYIDPVTYKIKVSATVAGATATPTPITFNVVITCTGSITVTSSIPTTSPSYTMTLGTSSYTLASTTFASNNSLCQTSFTYAITPCDSSTGPITTCTPTNLSAITYSTNSCTDVKTHSYTITATDSKSGKTATKTFSIQVTAGKVQSITNTSSPGAQTYNVGSTAATIALPAYSHSPTCTTPAYTYSVSAVTSANAAPAASLSLTVDSTGIKVSTTKGSDAGSYTVTITTSVTDTALTSSKTFSLTIMADPTIVFDAISQVDYVIGGTAQTRAISYTITPEGAPNAVTLSVKLDDGSANGAALPASVTFSGTTITVDQQTYIDPVTYKIKVSATVAGATATPTPITFNVVITCTGSITVTSSIPTTSPSYTMTLGTSSYPLASTTFASNNSLCQTSFTYAITPCDSSTGPITSCSPTNLSAITYSTNNCNDVKTHSYTITATDSKSGKTATKTFSIQVTAGKVQSITNTSSPGAQTYNVGSTAATIALPAYSHSPTCTTPAYTYSVSAVTSANSAPAASLSLTVDSTGIKVSTTKGSDAGSYTVTITTSVTDTALTSSKTFSLTITADPTIVFDSISQVDYVIGGTAQTRTISYTITPEGAPNAVTLSVKLDDGSANGAALPASVTFSGTTITVNQQTYIDPVTYKIKVSATVAGATATPTPITFNVVITCTGSITVTSSIPTTSPSYTMTLGTSSYTLASTTFASNNNLCQTSFTYAITPCDSSTGPITTCTPTNLSAITYSTNSCTDVKTHSYTITATDSKSGKTATKTFSIQVTAGNVQSMTIKNKIADTSYLVGQGDKTIALPTYDTVPTCVTPSFTYTLQTDQNFITVSGAGIVVNTAVGSKTGDYTVTIRTKDTNSALFNDQSFTLKVNCVTEITVSGVVGATALLADNTFVYYLSETKSVLTVTAHPKPTDCPTTGFTYNWQSINSGIPSTLPSPPFTVSSNQLEVYDADKTALQKTYEVKVTITDPRTTTSASFRVYAQTLCTRSIVIDSKQISTIMYVPNLNTLTSLDTDYPVFKENPAGCPVGTISRVMSFTGTGTAPTFVTTETTGSGPVVRVQTKNSSDVGTYTFDIVATDSLTSLKQTNSFSIVVGNPVLATDLKLDDATKIADRTYTLPDPGSAASIDYVNVPSYAQVPSNADVSYGWTVSLSPAASSANLVTVVNNQVKITSSTQADAGIYTVTVKLTEKFSGLERSTTFKLTVKCIKTLSAPTDTTNTFYIGDLSAAAELITINDFAITPTGCTVSQLTYTVGLSSGSLPSSITKETNNALTTVNKQQLKVYETVWTNTGSYAVKVTANDPISGLSAVWTVNIDIKCTKSLDILSGTIASFTYWIDMTTLQTSNPALPTYKQNPASCAVGTISRTLEYTGSGTAPTFISVVSNAVQVQTQTAMSETAFTYKIKAVDSLTGLTNESNTFTITVKLKAKAITLRASTAVADLKYLVSDTAKELALPVFDITESQAVIDPEYKLENAPSFVAITTNASGAQVIKIYTTSVADSKPTGVYDITIRFTDKISTLSATNDFKLTVTCVRQIKKITDAAWTSVAYYLSETAVYRNPALSFELVPADCRNDLTYTVTKANGDPLPSPTISLENSKIKVYDSNLSATQTTYSLKIVATDPLTTVKNEELTLSVSIACTRSLDVTNAISDFTYGPRVSSLYTLDQALGTYSVKPAGCPQDTITYELKYYTDAAFTIAGTLPAFIQSATPTTKISIGTQDTSLKGAYYLQVIATEPKTSLVNNSNKFTLTVADGYFISTLQIDTKPADCSYFIGQGSLTLDQHTYSFTPTDAETSFVYSIASIEPVPSTDPAPSATLFTLQTQTNGASKIVINSSTPSDTGVYKVTYKIKESYSNRSVTAVVTVTIKCVKTITAGSSTTTNYEIGSGSVTVNFPTYTLAGNTGITCPDKLTVTSVTKSDGTALPSQISYTSGKSVSVLEADQMNRNQQFTIKVTVKDPLTEITNSDLQLQVNIQCTRYVGYCYPPCAPNNSPTDWIVAPTGTTDFAVRPDTSETFNVVWSKLVTDTTNCAHVQSFTALEFGSPDTTKTAVTVGTIFTVANSTDGTRQELKIDPSMCTTCDFTKPSEFKVTTRIAANPLVWFPSLTQTLQSQSFQVLKIMQNPSATTTYGTDVLSIDMKDAFITNFDSVTSTGYSWLKKDSLTFTLKSCVADSITQAITGYDYCANAFYQDTISKNLVKVKSYTQASGSYTLKFEATHSKTPGQKVESVSITVQVQNNCNDGTVKLNSQTTSGEVIPYRTKSDLTATWTSLLSEANCVKMSKDSKLLFSLEKLTYGSTVVVDSTTNSGSYRKTIPDTFSGETIKALGTGSQFDFSSQSLLTYKVSAMYDTADTVLAALRSPTTDFVFNVFKITPSAIEILKAVIDSGSNQPFTLKAVDKISTNMSGDYDKSKLTFTYTCTNPTVGSDTTTATTNDCCSLLFTWSTNTLTKNNVAPSKFCDGLYSISIVAKHPSFASYTETYTASIDVKYDCNFLTTSGLYAAPTSTSANVVTWKNSDQANEASTSTLKLTIEDPAIDVVNPLVHSATTYTYSCSVQYEFACPNGETYCTEFTNLFTSSTSTAMVSNTMWSKYPLSTQFRVKATTSHKAYQLLNGKNLKINAYIFSTEQIATVKYNASSPPTNNPQYGGATNYKATLSWTVKVDVTKNCAASFISIRQRASDSLAQISSTVTATAIVQSAETDRVKKVARMELTDQYDNSACIGDFNKFELKSAQLSNSFATMFSFKNSGDANVNSEIKLIAQANSQVSSPTCKLSTKTFLDANQTPVYTQSCDFKFEIEAFIGTKSYGAYTTVTYTVKNECLGFGSGTGLSNLWSFRTDTSSDPIKSYAGLSNNYYEIWHSADSKQLYLPRILPQLASAALGFPTIDQECGSFKYKLIGELSSAFTIAVASNNYPVLTISAKDPSLSGQSASTDYVATYNLDISAEFGEWKGFGIFKYSETKLASQPSLSVRMQDRCIGMTFDMPQVSYDYVDQSGTTTTRKFIAGDVIGSVNYIMNKPSMKVQVTRITPYLYPIPGDSTKTLAGTRCGDIMYKPVVVGFESVVTWQDSQINPTSSTTAPLEFFVSTSKAEDVGKKTMNLAVAPKLTGYKERLVYIPFEIEGAVVKSCITAKVLSFKRNGERTDFKYYRTPYTSTPSDLEDFGPMITAKIPSVTSSCPEMPIIYKISATGDLLTKGCLIPSPNYDRMDLQTICLDMMKPGYYIITVTVRASEGNLMPDDTFTVNLFIADTPVTVTSTKTSNLCMDPITCKYLQIFQVYDTNNDGKVDVVQLGPMVKDAGLTPTTEQLSAMQQQVDPKQTGSFTAKSLVQSAVVWDTTTPDCIDPFTCKLAEIFQTYDPKATGKVTTTQLSSILKEAGMTPTTQVLATMMSQVDPKGTGSFTVKDLTRSAVMWDTTPDCVDPLTCKFFKLFQTYDTKNIGRVANDKLEALVKEGGMNPSEQQLQAMLQQVDPTSVGSFTAKQLTRNVGRWETMIKIGFVDNGLPTMFTQTREIVIPPAPIVDIIDRWTPPKSKVTQNNNQFVPPLVLNVVEVNEVGVLNLAFNRIVGLNAVYFEKFKENTQQMLAGFGRRLTSEPRELAVEDMLNGQEYQFLLDVIATSFTVEYRPRYNSIGAIPLNFWVKDFKNFQDLNLQLDFTDPILVSKDAINSDNLTKDQIFVELASGELFLDPITGKPLKKTLLPRTEATCPKQLPVKFQQAMSATSTVFNSMSTSMGLIFLLNLFFGFGLKYLWKAINILQFIIYTGDWRISPPSNLEIFFKQAAFFARGEWIPKNTVMKALHFEIGNDDPQIKQLRFLIMIFAIVTAMGLLLLGLLYIFKKFYFFRHFAWLAEQQRKWIFWNGFIRTGLQAYLDSAIFVFCLFLTKEGKQVSWLKIILGGVGTVVLISCVIGTYLFLRNKYQRKELKDIEVDTKFGTLWFGIDVNNFKAVQYSTVFLIRRIVFALLSVFLGKVDGGLIMIAVVYLCMANQVFYLLPVSPNAMKKDQIIEVISELLLMYFFYGVMLAEEFDDPMTKFRIGWFSVTAVALILLINIASVLHDAVMGYYKYLRRQYELKFGRDSQEIARKKSQTKLEKLRSRLSLDQSSRKSGLDQSDRKGLFQINEVDENAEIDSEPNARVDQKIIQGMKRLKELENLEEISQEKGESNSNSTVNAISPNVKDGVNGEIEAKQLRKEPDDKRVRSASNKWVVSLDDMVNPRPITINGVSNQSSSSGTNGVFGNSPSKLRSETKSRSGYQVAEELADRILLDPNVLSEEAKEKHVLLDDMIAPRQQSARSALQSASSRGGPRRKISIQDIVVQGYKDHGAEVNSSRTVTIGDQSFRDASPISYRRQGLSGVASNDLSARTSQLMTPDTAHSPRVFIDVADLDREQIEASRNRLLALKGETEQNRSARVRDIPDARFNLNVVIEDKQEYEPTPANRLAEEQEKRLQDYIARRLTRDKIAQQDFEQAVRQSPREKPKNDVVKEVKSVPLHFVKDDRVDDPEQQLQDYITRRLARDKLRNSGDDELESPRRPKHSLTKNKTKKMEKEFEDQQKPELRRNNSLSPTNINPSNVVGKDALLDRRRSSIDAYREGAGKQVAGVTTLAEEITEIADMVFVSDSIAVPKEPARRQNRRPVVQELSSAGGLTEDDTSNLRLDELKKKLFEIQLNASVSKESLLDRNLNSPTKRKSNLFESREKREAEEVQKPNVDSKDPLWLANNITTGPEMKSQPRPENFNSRSHAGSAGLPAQKFKLSQSTTPAKMEQILELEEDHENDEDPSVKLIAMRQRLEAIRRADKRAQARVTRGDMHEP